MGNGFQIGDFLGKVPQTQRQAERQNETVIVDIYKLKNNETNPYNLNEIESLAQQLVYASNMPMIEAARINGEYIIWSGHRRTKAIIYGIEHGYSFPKNIIDNGKIKIVLKDFDKEAELYGQGVYTADDFKVLDLVLPNKGQRRDYSVEEIAKEIDMLEPVIHKKFNYESVKGSFRAYFAYFLGMPESNLQRYFSYRKLSKLVKERIAQDKIKFTAATNYLAKLPVAEQDGLVLLLEAKNIDITEKSILAQTTLQKEESFYKKNITDLSLPQDQTENDLEEKGQTVLDSIQEKPHQVHQDEVEPVQNVSSQECDDDSILENLGLEQIPLQKIPVEYGKLVILLKEKDGGFFAGFLFKGVSGKNPTVEKPGLFEQPKEKSAAIKDEIEFLIEYGTDEIKQALYAGNYAADPENSHANAKTASTEAMSSAAVSENQKVRIRQIKSTISIQVSHLSVAVDTNQLVNELKNLKDYIEQVLSEEES